MAEEFENESQDAQPEDDDGDLSGMDFNVEDEYKPDPLIPKGTYHGVVNKVTLKASQYCLIWDVCLHDNGGVMNDGETPIDGAHVFFRNWLPKPGDEKLMTASGRNTKRQSKINMLKQFEEELGINMATPQIIAVALTEAQWVGLEVSVEVDAEEWNAKFRNVVNRMKKSTLYTSNSIDDSEIPF
jgi:hypothetical protein